MPVAEKAMHATALVGRLNANMPTEKRAAILKALSKLYRGTHFVWAEGYGLELLTAELERLPKAIKYTAVTTKQVSGMYLIIRKDRTGRFRQGSSEPIGGTSMPRSIVLHAEALVRAAARSQRRQQADVPSVWDWLRNPAL